jgi:hypothetical protein
VRDDCARVIVSFLEATRIAQFPPYNAVDELVRLVEATRRLHATYKLDVSALRIRCRTHDFGCVAFREVVGNVKLKCEFQTVEVGD